MTNLILIRLMFICICTCRQLAQRLTYLRKEDLSLYKTKKRKCKRLPVRCKLEKMVIMFADLSSLCDPRSWKLLRDSKHIRTSRIPRGPTHSKRSSKVRRDSLPYESPRDVTGSRVKRSLEDEDSLKLIESSESPTQALELQMKRALLQGKEQLSLILKHIIEYGLHHRAIPKVSAFINQWTS